MTKNILLFLLLNLSVLGSAQLSFTTSATFAVRKGPRCIISADFNGDGNIDLATANSLADSVTVSLGNGQGNFSNTNFSVGSYPCTVISGDFNGDGKTDLITANKGSNNVSVLIGNGLGSFSAAVSYSVGPNIQSVISSDFNSDGKADLAVTSSYLVNGQSILILLGDGLGGFGSPVSFPSGGNGPFSVTNGDFNGDGITDLVAANMTSNNIALLIGNGAGSFSTSGTFSVGSQPCYVSKADLNNDGKLDIVTSNQGSGNVSVLLGNGLGNFSSATNYSVGTTPYCVVSADLNGDGKPDLISSNSCSYDLSILKGNGSGSFLAASNFTVGDTPTSVTCADFNNDGKMDLASVNFNTNNATILINTTVDGIEILTKTKSFLTVYPNPSNGSFSVALSVYNETACHLRIINSLNVIVWEETVQKEAGGEYQFKINKRFPSGIYYVYLETNEGVDCRKIIVE